MYATSKPRLERTLLDIGDGELDGDNNSLISVRNLLRFSAPLEMKTFSPHTSRMVVTSHPNFGQELSRATVSTPELEIPMR